MRFRHQIQRFDLRSKPFIRSVVIFSLFITVSFSQTPYAFTYTACNIHYGSARKVVLGDDNTVFLITNGSGMMAFNWDGTDQSGRQVATGIYFYQRTAVSSETGKVFTQSNKMLFLK